MLEVFGGSCCLEQQRQSKSYQGVFVQPFLKQSHPLHLNEKRAKDLTYMVSLLTTGFSPHCKYGRLGQVFSFKVRLGATAPS